LRQPLGVIANRLPIGVLTEPKESPERKPRPGKAHIVVSFVTDNPRLPLYFAIGPFLSGNSQTVASCDAFAEAVTMRANPKVMAA